jgi:hypothetical protein
MEPVHGLKTDGHEEPRLGRWVYHHGHSRHAGVSHGCCQEGSLRQPVGDGKERSQLVTSAEAGDKGVSMLSSVRRMWVRTSAKEGLLGT